MSEPRTSEPWTSVSREYLPSWKVLSYFGHQIYIYYIGGLSFVFLNFDNSIGFLYKSWVILCWFIIPVVRMTIPFLRRLLASPPLDPARAKTNPSIGSHASFNSHRHHPRLSSHPHACLPPLIFSISILLLTHMTNLPEKTESTNFITRQDKTRYKNSVKSDFDYGQTWFWDGILIEIMENIDEIWMKIRCLSIMV